MSRLVQLNDRGLRICESHPRAILSDHEVDLLLELRQEGLTYRRLASVMEISIKQAWRICVGHQRGQVPTKFKRA
jgi:hypothetical protein